MVEVKKDSYVRYGTRGRPHKVCVYGLVAVLLGSVLSVFIAGTQAWMSMARYLQSFGG